ncbi:unnamed protein product [Sphenostylis stenocarpa]|uniref:Uncharacterized protein n=1 Tax=Sphenostylis stenocarpa TaxID=92480 RepID=A0AA86S960_9FABA|nr:unnamed protein product [Sphenostylis stenocarpa]
MKPPHNRLSSSAIYIQEYNLDLAFSDMANVTKENLKGLSDTGINLLKEKVVRMNLDTFNFEDAGEGTNAEALDRLAEILYEERQDRLKRKSTERGGRPFVEALGNKVEASEFYAALIAWKNHE